MRLPVSTGYKKKKCGAGVYRTEGSGKPVNKINNTPHHIVIIVTNTITSWVNAECLSLFTLNLPDFQYRINKSLQYVQAVSAMRQR